MRAIRVISGVVVLSGLSSLHTFSGQEQTQEPTQPSNRTMRPVLRGRDHAVSSMKPEATAAAVKILEAGGNAFDAIVAGQAVLALVDPESNGIGSRRGHPGLPREARNRSYSINAEGTAPKLATIDWYNKNNGGKIPTSDGLLSASLPGVIDAWYVLLDRWGTMTFAQVLEQAIDVAENGFPIGDGLARAIAGSRKIQKYPTRRRCISRMARPRSPARSFATSMPPRMLRKLVEAEQAAAAKGRHAALPGRARSLLQRRHRQDHGGVLRTERRPVSVRGFRGLHRQGRNTGVGELSRLRSLQEPVRLPGSRGAVPAEHPGGL